MGDYGYFSAPTGATEEHPSDAWKKLLTGPLPAPEPVYVDPMSGIGNTPAPPAANIAPPQQQAPAPNVPTLGDAALYGQLTQGGGARRDPNAVRALAATRADTQGLLTGAADTAAAAGDARAAAADEAAGVMAQRAAYVEQWAAEQAQANALRQEEGAKRRAAVEAKAVEASEAAQNLDANRLMKGGGGVMFSIAAALGAFGASLTKGPNFALQIMQDALDRDLETQREGVRGKKEDASFAREMYDGFRAEGQDELSAKMSTRAAMLDAFATKIDAVSAGARGRDEKAKGQQEATNFRLEANRLKEQVQEAAARPQGGGKGVDLLKIQGQMLDNEKKAAELAGGGTAAGKSTVASGADVQGVIEGIRQSAGLVGSLDKYAAEGQTTIPGRGGLTDIGRGIRTSVSKTVTGGSGEEPLEADIRAGVKALGYQMFRQKAGNSPNTAGEQEVAETMGGSDGSIAGVRSRTIDATKAEITRGRAMLEAMPEGREKTILSKQLDEAAAAVAVSPDDYRKRFGSKK